MQGDEQKSVGPNNYPINLQTKNECGSLGLVVPTHTETEEWSFSSFFEGFAPFPCKTTEHDAAQLIPYNLPNMRKTLIKQVCTAF